VAAQGRTRQLVPALVATLGLALTGCGAVSNPGAAAQVGDDTISVSFLQEQLDQLLESSRAGQADQPAPSVPQLAENQRALLQQLIYDDVIVATGERLDVSVSQSDIDRVKAEIRSQRVFIPAGMLEEFAHWVALRRELSAHLLGRAPQGQAEQAEADRLLGDEMTETAKQVGVKVNPRYGRWDGSQLVPGGQLVTPKPASPEPQLPQAPPAP
jgi:SurA N-terminal domain